MSPTQKRRASAHVLLIATSLLLLCASPAFGSEARYARVEPACTSPAPGEARCLAVGLVPVAAREAGRPGVRPLARAAASQGKGPAGGLTPEQLAAAYGIPEKGGADKTVAVVDAYDAPNIEEDLAKFSEEFGLPACTSKSGCFKKINENGFASPLPTADKKGWSVEVSLDVETVHAVCPECHILLVESWNAELINLGTAVATAVKKGADVVSNSYGAPEVYGIGSIERALFEHPGTVIAAATGDLGFDGWRQTPRGTPDVPASLPGVVAVGGTTLKLAEGGGRESETVWAESGGGCSAIFPSPFWQRYAPGFAGTGCGEGRLDADVSADADPASGFSVLDTYDCGSECTRFIGGGGWARIGGTSLSTPLIGALFALAGGADGIAYPALTLYAHLGDPSLFDVEQGGNGLCFETGSGCSFGPPIGCEGRTACNAAPGYDGPSGVGAPQSIAAFEPVPEEELAAQRRAEEAIAAEARRKAEEEAPSNPPPPAPAPSSGQGGTAGFKASKAIPAAVLRGSSLQAGRGGSVTVRIACPAGETTCTGVVSVRTLGAVIAGPGARASILTLASGRFAVSGGQVVAVRLRLTRRGAALLARNGKLRVRVLIVAHDPAGAQHSSHTAATLHAFKRR